MENGDLALMLFGAIAATWLPFDLRRRSGRRRRRTAVATGEVVGVEALSSSDVDGSVGPATFHARIAFATASGRRGECVDPSGVSWRKPSMGAHVDVAYEPGNPHNAVPVGSDHPRLEGWLGWLGILIGSAMFLAGALRSA